MYNHNILIGIETEQTLDSTLDPYLTYENKGNILDSLKIDIDETSSRYLTSISAIFDASICNMLKYLSESLGEDKYHLLLYDIETEHDYVYGSLESVINPSVETKIETTYSIGYTVPTSEEEDEDEEAYDPTGTDADATEVDATEEEG